MEFPSHFSLAELLVLAGTASTGGMAPPASARISARINVLGTESTVKMVHTLFWRDLSYSRVGQGMEGSWSPDT